MGEKASQWVTSYLTGKGRRSPAGIQWGTGRENAHGKDPERETGGVKGGRLEIIGG